MGERRPRRRLLNPDSAWPRLSWRARTVWGALMLAAIVGLILSATTDWRWVHVIAPVCTLSACFTMLLRLVRKPSDGQ